MFNNTLIQYQGGGYDGCFWEWNYAYFDVDGQFNNIYSSGYNGCGDLLSLSQYIDTHDQDKDYYVIHLNDEQEVENFINDSNPGHIISIAKYLDENFGIDLQGNCDICGQKTSLAYCVPEGFEGCGGIAIQATEKVCEECYCSKSCSYCGEYFGADYDSFDERGYCEYCQESQATID